MPTAWEQGDFRLRFHFLRPAVSRAVERADQRPEKERTDMRKLLALPLIAAVACGGGALKDQARDAMPTKETVAMGSPQSQPATSTSGQDTVQQNSTLGQSSPFFTLTAGLAVAFNLP